MTDPFTLLVALAAGAGIGTLLGTLGAGGSIFAVPVLALVLGQSPAQASTGSLVVVGVSALVAAVAAARRGRALVARGVIFALLASGGVWLGAAGAARVPGAVLLGASGALMLLVAVLTVRRGAVAPTGPPADEPILTFRPFTCACPRAAKVLVTATLVGVVTGFLGIGGGFLVVPALALGLGLGMDLAAGTSLVVIAVTSTLALAARHGAGLTPDWPPVLLLTAAATVAALVAGRFGTRLDPAALRRGFVALLTLVGLGTTAAALATLA